MCNAYIGWVFAVLAGLGMPSFVFLMGNILDSFSPNSVPDDMINTIKRLSWILCCIGVYIFITTYIYYYNLLAFSEKVTLKTRVAYLKSILKQDSEWFDLTNPAELSSRIGKETLAI
jgi:ABC-type multidrug transport system fused ATPase/permease subunit